MTYFDQDFAAFRKAFEKKYSSEHATERGLDKKRVIGAIPIFPKPMSPLHPPRDFSWSNLSQGIFQEMQGEVAWFQLNWFSLRQSTFEYFNLGWTILVTAFLWHKNTMLLERATSFILKSLSQMNLD